MAGVSCCRSPMLKLSDREKFTLDKVADVLEEAPQPLTAGDISRALGGSHGQNVSRQLAVLARRGQAICLSGHKNQPTLWVGGENVIRAVGEAYPPLITWYRRHDPALAALLQSDYDHFKKGHTPFTGRVAHTADGVLFLAVEELTDKT